LYLLSQGHIVGGKLVKVKLLKKDYCEAVLGDYPGGTLGTLRIHVQ
jgi:hypothetical protein